MWSKAGQPVGKRCESAWAAQAVHPLLQCLSTGQAQRSQPVPALAGIVHISIGSAPCPPRPDALLPRAACAPACCFARYPPLPCPQPGGFLLFLRMIRRLCSACLNGSLASGAAATKRHRSGARNACAVNARAAPTPGPVPGTPVQLRANARPVTGMKPRRSVTNACFASAGVAPMRVPAPVTPAKSSPFLMLAPPVVAA